MRERERTCACTRDLRGGAEGVGRQGVGGERGERGEREDSKRERARILSKLHTQCRAQRGARSHEPRDHDLGRNQELDEPPRCSRRAEFLMPVGITPKCLTDSQDMCFWWPPEFEAKAKNI